MTTTIQLTHGKSMIVDDEDARPFTSHRWHVSPNGYARRGAKNKGTTKIVYAHRLVMSAPDEMEVDHINGNKLDNRKANLRLCTSLQNLMHRGAHKTNVTGMRGVHLDRARNLFKARIKKDGKEIFLGRFKTIEEAAKRYDAAASALHGEFAWRNLE